VEVLATIHPAGPTQPSSGAALGALHADVFGTTRRHGPRGSSMRNFASRHPHPARVVGGQQKPDPSSWVHDGVTPHAGS
ncbi:MAG TPA: hypothetical protein VF926_02725, partial [Mycobacterium sp.]